ncbi:MAG: aminopeptidase P family protein [Candidatus Omnitrophica bacterium]|nr:aminopeptidase P family protein [Candidatus Omnitrophota bacterium]
MHTDRPARLKKLFALLDKKQLDGLLLAHPANISYLAHLPSRDSWFLASRKGNCYFTDARYAEETRRKIPIRCKIAQTNGAPFKTIGTVCQKLHLKRIGFEERYFSYSEYRQLKRNLASAALHPLSGIVEELRQTKEPLEIRKIEKAVSITQKTLRDIEPLLKPGKKEIEIVAELERLLRYKGAGDSSFNIIVASGPNASFPHHIPGERKLKRNEGVIIDIGVDYSGYKSDLTRVFFLGKIEGLLDRIFKVTLEAQKRAIAAIKPGVLTSEIDRIARTYIASQGLGEFFIHNLGHGVGLEVHEEPSFSRKTGLPLQEGMVFTVEPGLYIPGRYGVRIEDMVLVTEKGCRQLSWHSQ